MKKTILYTLTFLGLFSFTFGQDFLNANCNQNSNKTLNCQGKYQSLQNIIDNAFDRFLQRNSGNNLTSRLENLQTNINFKKLELIGNGNLSDDIRFLFDYLNYRIDAVLNNNINNMQQNNTDNGVNITTINYNSNISITRSDNFTGTISLNVGSSNIVLIKFKVQNNSDNDINLDSFKIDTNSNAFISSNFKLYFDQTRYISANINNGIISFNNIGASISKNSWKEFVLQGDLNSNFNGIFGISIKDVSIKGINGNFWNVSTSNFIPQNFITNGFVQNTTSNNTNTNNPTNYNYYQNPTENIIAAGSDQLIDVGAYKFRVKYMDALIQSLTLVNIGANTATEINQNNALSLASNQADSIVNKVYLYSADGRELASGILVNGIVNFSLNNATIPYDTDFLVIVKVKLNKITNTTFDNKILRFGMLKIGDCLNGYCSKVIFKNTGASIAGIGVGYGSFDATILYPQYIRNSAIKVSSLLQSNTSVAGTMDLWGFNATSLGADSKLKEFRFNAYIYDSNPSGFNIGGNSLSLYINGQKISDNDIKFYNAQGNCNSLQGSQIVGQANMYGAQNTTNNYCIKVVFDGSYFNGYNLNKNSNYQFKITAQGNSFSSMDSVTTNMSQYGLNKNINTYNILKNDITSIIWSDNIVDGLNLDSLNRYTDSLIGLDTLNSWTSRM